MTADDSLFTRAYSWWNLACDSWWQPSCDSFHLAAWTWKLLTACLQQLLTASFLQLMTVMHDCINVIISFFIVYYQDKMYLQFAKHDGWILHNVSFTLTTTFFYFCENLEGIKVQSVLKVLCFLIADIPSGFHDALKQVYMNTFYCLIY